jgi:hypothetical protein
MSDTPTTEESEVSKEFKVVAEALGRALFHFLTDETFTEDELEVFSVDVEEVAYTVLGVFLPKVIETLKNEDGSETFTFHMTIPDGDISEVMKESLSYLTDTDFEYDDDDDDDDDSDE